MAITEEQVKHVAKLSKLSFSEELADFTNQLDKIIDMVELLEEVDTTGVPFTSNVNESINVMREDVATPGMDRKELMRNVRNQRMVTLKCLQLWITGGRSLMEKLYDKSLTELHDLLVSKEITAVDLTEETLNRIQDTEEQLGSFITVSEEKAMALAKAIDLKGITESNPLAGIPIGIKDNIVTKDILTTAGSKCYTILTHL